MRKWIYITLAAIAVLLLGMTLWIWSAFWGGPTPIDELAEGQDDFDASAYESTIDGEDGKPEILILGTIHFNQHEHDFSDEAFDRATGALAGYEPDMLVVEHLPHDWEPGRGRDYRPELPLDELSGQWNMSRKQADSLLGEPGGDPCRHAKAYLLNRDLPNALYYNQQATCPELRDHPEVDSVLTRYDGHEMDLLGFPAARKNGVDEVVLFDYQGEDTRWFIYDELMDGVTSGSLRALSGIRTSLVQRTELQEHIRQYFGSLQEHLRLSNSPEWLRLQHWVYEENMRENVTYRDAGARQVDNYWGRNERMFAYLEEAVAEQNPERVLVIVGAGHKYFLDELARESGYTWVDPRDFLP